MGLHGEPVIRSLHPERFADSLDLRCHSLLLLERKKMLNHRIAEGHFEAAIRKLGKIRGVAGKRRNVIETLFLRRQIKAKDLDIFPGGPAPVLPELIRSSDVEDSQRTGQTRSQRLKLPEPARSHPVRK